MADDVEINKDDFGINGLESIGFSSFGSPAQNGIPDPSINPEKSPATTPSYTDTFNKLLNTSVFEQVGSPVPNNSNNNSLEYLDQGMLNTPSLKYTDRNAIEQYIYQDDFTDGFDPFDPTNHDRWVASETWSSALSKGFDSFGEKFGHTFTDYWKDYGRMAHSLVSMDAVNLLPSEEEMISTNYAEHLSAMKNYVFVPEEDEDAIFSKRSMSEFLGNAGFMAGTFAALSTELLADALITLGTGGAGAVSFGGTFARIGGKLLFKAGAKQAGKGLLKKGITTGGKKAAKEGAKKGNFFTGLLLADESLDVIKSTKTLNQVNKLTKHRSVSRSMKKAFSEIFGLGISSALKSKNFLDGAWSITKGVPLLGTGLRYGEKAIAAAKAGRGFGEAAGIAFKGLRRVGQEFNLASTEAAFEAVSSYGSTLEKMIQTHTKDGKELDPFTFTKMRDAAGKASFANYGTNLAILLATNKIQFGSLFSRMGIAGKYAKEIIEDGGSTLLVKNISKKAGAKAAKVYNTSGFFGFYGKLGKISKDFSKKQALYEVGKRQLKGIGRFEVTEGLQENLQETSNAAWRDYYAGQVNGVNMTLTKAFESGLAEQFTKQGFRTFLQGALTGSFMRLPVHITQSATQAVNEYAVSKAYEARGQESPMSKYKQSVDTDINTVNDFIDHVSESDKNLNTILDFTGHLEESMNMTEAATNGNDYDFVNAKDNSFIKAAEAANRLNSIEAVQHTLQHMGQHMSKEEFEEGFNIKLEETKYSSVQEFADNVSERLGKYSKTIDNVRKRVKKKLINPLEYSDNQSDFVAAKITRDIQEQAIQLIALNEIKASRASERAKKVFDDYNSIEGLSESSDYMFKVLTNPDNLETEGFNLQADIKIIEEGLAQEGLTKEEIKKLKEDKLQKETELDLLNTWKNFWGTRDEILGDVDISELSEEEKQQLISKKLDSFIGVKSKEKVTIEDEEGNITEEYEYKTQDPEVIEVLTKLLNIKNKQLGIGVEVKVKDVQEGITKIVDFIQLEQDSKDYLNSVDALSSPENYRQTVKRMKDGRFKSYLLDYVDSLANRTEWTVINILEDADELIVELPDGKSEDKKATIYFPGKLTKEEFEEVKQKVINEVIESEPFNEIMKLIINKDLGLGQSEQAKDLMRQQDEIIKNSLKNNLQKFVPEYQFDEVVSDEDYKKFTEDKKNFSAISSTVKDAIIDKVAKNKNGVSSLTPREREIYNAFQGTFEVEVEAIKKQSSASVVTKGIAYYQKNKSGGYDVYDKEGNFTERNVTEEQAKEAIKKLNEPVLSSKEQELQDKKDAIRTATVDAISNIQEDVIDEQYPGFSTIFDYNGNAIYLVGQTREALIAEIEKTAAELSNSVDGKVGQNPEVIVPEEDVELPSSASSEAASNELSLVNELQILEAAEAAGETTTPDGLPIAERKKQIFEELEKISPAKEEETPENILTAREAIISSLYTTPDSSLIQTDGLPGVTWQDKQTAIDEINQGVYDEQILKVITPPAAPADTNVSSETVNENVTVVEEGEESEEEDTEFKVIDSKGKVIAVFDTQEQAEQFEQDQKNIESNLKFTEKILLELGQKKSKKGRFKKATVVGLYEVLVSKMEAKNKRTSKQKTNNTQYSLLEEFYNSGKQNRNSIISGVNSFIKSDSEIQKREVKAPETEEVNTKPNVYQSSSETAKQTKSQQFDKDVKKLYDDLKSTTSDKSGQIGLVFPEGTTDFTKFVNKSAEDIAIDQLANIKFSCKK